MNIVTWCPTTTRLGNRSSKNAVSFYVIFELCCTQCEENTSIETKPIEILPDRKASPALTYVNMAISRVSQSTVCRHCGDISGIPEQQISELRANMSRTVTDYWLTDQMASQPSIDPVAIAAHHPRLHQDALRQLIAVAEQKVPPGSIWEHYKTPGSQYRVLCIGLIEASEEASVVYSEGEGLNWVRPLTVFLEVVRRESGKPPLHRFSRIDQEQSSPTE